jgi:calreticulin
VKSSWKKSEGTAGDWTWTAGKYFGDAEADKGIQTGPDARFFAIAAPFDKPVDTTGKTLVLQARARRGAQRRRRRGAARRAGGPAGPDRHQSPHAAPPRPPQFSVKHEQKLDCGGGYIKLLPKSSCAPARTALRSASRAHPPPAPLSPPFRAPAQRNAAASAAGLPPHRAHLHSRHPPRHFATPRARSKLEDFSGDTPYSIMFGPDICGYSTKKVHVILTKDGKNHLTKKDIPCETDELTHVYTLLLKPDNSYEVLVDTVSRHNGTLYEDYDILPARTIKDPEATKPEEWDERERIPDEADVKPEGYDDIPAKVVDPDAKKPEDWDDEDDGEWEAAMIPNPEYKGPWVQKTLANPEYKGKWVAPDIPNPEFKDEPQLYAFKDLAAVGIELWQVKAGSLFDNIVVTDDAKYAAALAEKTWGASKAAEKAAQEAAAAKAAEEAEAAAKAAREAAAEEGDDDDDEEDDGAEAAAADTHDEL